MHRQHCSASSAACLAGCCCACQCTLHRACCQTQRCFVSYMLIALLVHLHVAAAYCCFAAAGPPATAPAQMVSDPTTTDIVCWNDKGDCFVVKNEFMFASNIMPQYFRHKNFSSFVRQLNFYGFHKRSSQSSLTSFHHPHFKRGRQDLLHLIQRKSTESSMSCMLANEINHYRTDT